MLRRVLTTPSLAGLALLAATTGAWADTTPQLSHSCIEVGSGLDRVVATVPAPQDCCTGRMQCSQYLSTTTLVRPRHDQHT